MKKIYFLLAALAAGNCVTAQTVANAGMETWRSGTTGTSPAITIHAPTSWYGLDSLVIADGEAFGSFIGAGSNWHAQLFQEGTIVHGGSSSAKMMTLKQDTLGYFAGMLSNSAIAVNVTALIAGGSFASAVSYSGGTPITSRVKTVSAWVRYTAGLDSITHLPGGIDSGSLNVNIYSHITSTGIDSLVGTGSVKIAPSATWTQVTATVVYTDTVDGADTARILFASSGQTGALDSSTLYVDDITMVYVPPSGVQNVIAGSDVNVYPNPVSGMLNIEGDNAGSTFHLFSVNGQLVATKALSGKDNVDVSALAEGLYFYTITDGGNTVKRGKVSVMR